MTVLHPAIPFGTLLVRWRRVPRPRWHLFGRCLRRLVVIVDHERVVATVPVAGEPTPHVGGHECGALSLVRLLALAHRLVGFLQLLVQLGRDGCPLDILDLLVGRERVTFATRALLGDKRATEALSAVRAAVLALPVVVVLASAVEAPPLSTARVDGQCLLEVDVVVVDLVVDDRRNMRPSFCTPQMHFQPLKIEFNKEKKR